MSRRGEIDHTGDHGKKIGKLIVRLDRVTRRVRWGFSGDEKATFPVDLRLNFHTGVFHAEHDGKWYSAKTKDDLEAKIKKAAERTIDLVWDRYLVIHYEATAKPLEIGTNAPSVSTGNVYDITSSRDKMESWRRKKAKSVIAGIELTWEIIEYTQPWTRPEDQKTVRSKRDVDYHEDDDGKLVESLGDPYELDGDDLPAAAVLWTREREQLLHDVLKMLAELDRRMVDLFRGDAVELAIKLDGLMLDPSRLLTAPPADAKPAKARRIK